MLVPNNHAATLQLRFSKNFLFYFVSFLFILLLLGALSLITYQAQLAEKNKNLEKAQWLDNQIWLYQYYQTKADRDLLSLQTGGKNFYLQIWPGEEYRLTPTFLLDPPNTKSLEEKFSSLDKSINFLIEREKTYRKIPLGWPLRTGRVTSPFGRRVSPFGYSIDFHTGTDFAAATGTPIYATSDGMVTFAGTRHDGYGYQVRLEHAYGFISLYGHCSKILVSSGQQVKRGDLIALVGMTGSATGPHVHYEIRLRQEDYLQSFEVFLNPWAFAKESL